jgi:FlaA1/EpsC-like NDP-sugar epimerase
LLIYGAGDAGLQLSQAIFSQDYFYNLVGFIDDNKNLQGRKINSVPIYSIDEIEDLINTKNVSCILLAIPSLSRKRNNEILHLISKYPISYKTLPNLSDLPKGSVNINNIIDIDVSELLGRNQVDPNQYLLKKNIQNKVVMITGAGGSIGGELCKQIIKLNPKKILLIENNEFALYSIYSELLDMQDFSNNLNNISVTCFLASVQDTDTIEKIFNLHKPHSVYHAAAFKHVPILESNVIEAIKNNVFGSLNIINSSIKNKVENFVLISTDKAVKPTSIMGVTKRLSEICLQSIYRHYSSFDKSITKLSIVRFGNVVNSSGSVIPRFKKQISLGGPVTLTHPDVSRYFMSIQEASELVIQAGAMSIGCNVFVLDMGSPIKIINIINQLVSQAGLSVRDSNNPDGEIEIKLVGLRPGEKMHEELFLNDNKEKTEHPKIFKTQDSIINWKELSQYVDRLKVLVDNYKISEISDLLKELPLDFDIKKEFSDSLFLQVDEKVN